MDDVLLVYASFGEGHKQAALSLQKFLNSPCHDLLDFCPSFVKKLYSLTYIYVSEYFPFLWHISFLLTKNKFINLVLAKVHHLLFRSFYEYLKDLAPKTVITTHFFPPALIGSIKKELAVKVISIVTDLRVHPLWVHPCIDSYCVALDETKKDLMRLGVEEQRIIAGVVPVREGFFKALSRQALRQKFGLNGKPCLLFVSSVRGRFPLLKEVLPILLKQFNVFIIYGINSRLKRYLGRLGNGSLRYFSFYTDFWELIHLSSILISKPGGLTTFEGICKRKPFIFTHYVPGQEKANMDVVLNYGIARFVKTKGEFLEAVGFFHAREEELQNNYPIKVDDIRPLLKELITRS
ncbi:MAG: hypothetical protein JSW17_01625 [Candidatus Omnitrophota bacterium]|nr:MAG: hypothetical protein JSW17_01625 [Candidatus Omnitrophota bacterium]